MGTLKVSSAFQIMKNFILLTVITAQICSYAQKKDEVVFRSQYKPETNYRNVMEMTSKNDITYLGSDEFISRLREAGVANPTKSEQITIIKSAIQTNTSKDGKRFPIRMKITDATMNNVKNEVLNGITFVGSCGYTGLPKFDAIESSKLSADEEASVLEIIQNTFTQLDIPETTVRVGDSFSQIRPFNLPMGDQKLAMDIKIDYKLISITNNTANFDLQIFYTFNIDGNNKTLSATGGGIGKMTYDVANFYITSYQSDSDIMMLVKKDKFDIEIKTKSISKLTSTITSGN